MKPIIVIPARLASTRLPDKPLADIAGKPMIVHVWERACAAQAGPVVVACAESEIADVIRDVGGRAVLTDPDLPSGSDRVHAALQEVDPAGTHDVVVNLQGDLPTLDPTVVPAVIRPLSDPDVDIATLAAATTDPAERDNPNVVKAVLAVPPGRDLGRALYFTRAPAPYGEGPVYHHIGIYAFRRAVLDHFVHLPPGILESREKLEQLRALERGLRIDAALVETVPFGVDTPTDLERARTILRR